MSPDPNTSLPPCGQCKRPMRPRGVLLREMLGTMAWGHSGKCKSCVQPNKFGDRPNSKAARATAAPLRPVVAGSADRRVQNNVQGLNYFLARRSARTHGPISAQEAFLLQRAAYLKEMAAAAAAAAASAEQEEQAA